MARGDPLVVGYIVNYCSFKLTWTQFEIILWIKWFTVAFQMIDQIIEYQIQVTTEIQR